MSFAQILRSGGCLMVAALLFCGSLPALAVIRDGGIDTANLGKGDWVYVVSECTAGMGGNVPSVTNTASFMAYEKSQGIRYIIVKAGIGSTNFPSDSSPQFKTSLCNAAHNAGLLIFGYTRSYGSDLKGEAALVDYIFNCGGDGFVFDAEVEWETRTSNPWITNGPLQSLTLGSMVRSNWPTKFIAHAPAGIISYHSTYPYKEFGSWCDAAMPMFYHYAWENIEKSPSGGIDWGEVNWRNWQNGLSGKWTNSIKPVYPVNHVYGPNPPNSGVSHIPDKQITEFWDCLSASVNPITAGGYKGMSFWRADLHGSVQWTNIKAMTAGDFTNQVNSIVIDNPKATKAGTWPSTRVFYDGTYYGATGTDTNSFGTNYYTKAQGTGTGYVTFTPGIVVPGDYNVYQWHVYHTNASASVPHIIKHSAGSTTVNANQKTNAGAWSILGKYNFTAGTGGYVRVTDAIAETNTLAIADGIKFIFVAPTSVPAPPNGLKATAVSTARIDLSWNDASTNETGFVVAQSKISGGPYTNIALTSINATNYSATNLPANTACYFVVRGTNYLGVSANSTPAGATTFTTAIAPSITTQPTNRTADFGTALTFFANASGTAPLDYRWRRNGVALNDGANISGATSTTLSLINVVAGDSAGYSVIVTNSAGSATSSNALLTVIDPLIQTPPPNQTAQTGDAVSFNIVAVGTLPLSYQWIFNSTNIPGATESNYIRSNISSADAGTYSVLVASGTRQINASAVLTVIPPPTLSVALQTTNILLSWPALYSNYVTEQKSFTNTNWAAFSSNTVPSNNQFNLILPVSEGGFFRLKKLLAP